MLTKGAGKYKVFLEKKELDEDILFILGGGEKSHIGGIVYCEKGKTPETIKFENHYDYVVLEIIADVACKKYDRNIVVIGGIHIDNASKEEIEIIIKNCKELAKCI
jgi:hypothetical protein